MSRVRKQSIEWKNSKGKELLIEDLRQGRIPVVGVRGDAASIYATREEFGGNNPDERRKFTARLRSARLHLTENTERARTDSAALAHDRQLYPETQINSGGEHRWDGSAAQLLLRQDIRENRHNIMTPLALHCSREEYLVFRLEQFRGHIYQEVKTQKYVRDRYSNQRPAIYPS